MGLRASLCPAWKNKSQHFSQVFHGTTLPLASHPPPKASNPIVQSQNQHRWYHNLQPGTKGGAG